MTEELKALVAAAKAVRKSLIEYDEDEHASGEIFYCEMLCDSVDLLSYAVKEYEESINEK
ncbi:hypothetical protein [Psychrobacter sp. AOP7-B1-24]|uniref:hypothetical protein n=1 Tax=Psychrobacter sp. AOP7-B1-24 TaxID=3457645 RepID=UPI00402BEDDD